MQKPRLDDPEESGFEGMANAHKGEIVQLTSQRRPKRKQPWIGFIGPDDPRRDWTPPKPRRRKKVAKKR